ncbi:ATP-binding protein [Prosthecodimorpha staleyi]|uniref:AAA family ATPase n=1 Tax=Prosthecodimorpha staleyi TaxID=2840188 RepID=A0A947DBM0_9HYPH|nr:YhaN family protein [Prosthecodimorpha staleyi]MBT9292792.1 AAA family ATPase [Prosthecodimorpha staleyi]
MRITRLDLGRYGPFSDKSLVFRPDARLHVVYGPNEAGKSTALAAVADLLFGIEERSVYNFLHPYPELWIGAEIVDRAGRNLAFRRRKRRKGALVDPSGRELPDDALLPFLGGIDRAQFLAGFGLSAKTLKSGGEELAQQAQDSGGQFFAADYGIHGVPALRQTLDDEADHIFGPRAKASRRFTQAQERYEAARRAIREHELGAQEWKRLTERISELSDAYEAARGRRIDVEREEKRLERVARVRPILAELDRVRTERAAIGLQPTASAGAAARVLEAIRTAGEKAAAVETARRELDDALGERAGIVVDRALLAEGGAIASLMQDLGRYTQALGSRPAAVEALDGRNARWAGLARQLGFADGAGLAAAEPGAAAIATLRADLAEGRRLQSMLETATGKVAEERRRLLDLEARRAAIGAPEDPGVLKLRREAFKPLIDRLQAHADKRVKLETASRILAQKAAQLDPPVADLADLAVRARPSVAAQKAFAVERSGLEAAITTARSALEAEIAAIEAADARLVALAAGGPVPTAEAIAAARDERDRLWRTLRAALWLEPGAPSGSMLAAMTAEFETAKAEADRLADTAVRDADRVARFTVETRSRSEAEARRVRAGERLAGLDRDWRDLHARWAAAWAPAGIAPLPPPAMEPWTAKLDGLIASLEEQTADRAELAEQDRQIAAALGPLRDLARAAGVAEADGLDFVLCARRLDAQLAVLAAAYDESRALAGGIAAARQALDERLAEKPEAEAALDRWRQAIAPRLVALGLAGDTGIDAVEAVLTIFASLPDLRDKIGESERQLARLDGVLTTFRVEAERLVAALAPDLAGLPPDRAATEIERRLAEARKAEAGRKVAEARVVRAEESLKRVEQDWAVAERHLAEQAAAAGLDRGEDLPARAAVLARAEELDRRLTDLLDQLGPLADGCDEATLRVEMAAIDPDFAAAQRQDFAAARSRIDEDVNRLYAERQEAIRLRDERGSGNAADLDWQAKRAAEAELAVAARDWAVLRTASLMIDAAIERHRESRRDPQVQRAGDLFRIVTGGAFQGLAQDWDDEKECLRIVGVRASGDRIDVKAMSEGTADQLYLALRLAHLEEHAARAEPAPFLGDDLFASFDDARTGFGLQVLAAIGGEVQPILFTHHRHVAAIARAELGDRADVIDLT